MNTNQIETFAEFVLLLKWLLDSFELSDISIRYSNNGLTMTNFIEHIDNDNMVIKEDCIRIKHDIVRLNLYDTGWQYHYNDSYEFILTRMSKDDIEVEISFNK